MMKKYIKFIISGIFWAFFIVFIVLFSTGGETPFIYTNF